MQQKKQGNNGKIGCYKSKIKKQETAAVLLLFLYEKLLCAVVFICSWHVFGKEFFLIGNKKQQSDD